MALTLVEKGLPDVRALRGGFNAWQLAGLPVSTGSKTD